MACRLAIAAIVLSMLVPATLVQAAPACQFQLGFAALQQLLPDRIGTCLDDARYDATSDAVQHTSNGLLAWRKSDNWTAFTDGYHTWVNGPAGVQERLNSQRFSWEANANGLPIADRPAAVPPAAPAAVPIESTAIRTVPAATVTTDGLTALADPALASVNGAAAVLAWVRNDAGTPLNTQLVATLTDSTNGVVGTATDTLTDLQPGQMKLVELASIAKASAVSGLRFQFTTVTAGHTTPASLKLSNTQIDPSAPKYVLATITNTDTTTHSGFVSVAITSASGSIEGIAFGPYDQLNPGLSKTVRCISLLGPVPVGAQLTAQVDTAL
ncbi:MAG: hypothetical protein ACR2JY_22335 [Chloroflexota bacterium]